MTYAAFVLTVFMAVVLLCGALLVWWQNTFGQVRTRLDQRRPSLSAQAVTADTAVLRRERPGPWTWLARLRRGLQVARIEAQLPDTLDLLARAMLAGHAFTSALRLAAKDAPPPLSQELQRVFDEVNYGLDLKEAMSAMAERVASNDVRFFVIAVLVQHETGGNLAAILQNTAMLIRERQKIRGVIRVLSGEGRVSAWILSVLPFVLAGVLNLLNPGFMSTLWTHALGLQMLQVCLLLMLLGVVWMWRLIDIRV